MEGRIRQGRECLPLCTGLRHIPSMSRTRSDHGPSRRQGSDPPPEPRLPLGEPPLRPNFARERDAMRRGVCPVAGCDEVGRGPLAGPVVAAAVILDPKRIPRGLDDSKRLAPSEREKLYERICATAHVGIAFGSRGRIDRDNIRQASLWALAGAVAALPVRPRLVLVDGIDHIDSGCDCEAIVAGDARVLSIAAASIIAKVVRDRLMRQIGTAHPGYGFERHMGYAVPAHRRALDELGPTIHHRRSFAPVAAAYRDAEAMAGTAAGDLPMPICHVSDLSALSGPALSGPPETLYRHDASDVDAHDKCGRDEARRSPGRASD
jgi:ribonuclease HII